GGGAAGGSPGTCRGLMAQGLNGDPVEGSQGDQDIARGNGLPILIRLDGAAGLADLDASAMTAVTSALAGFTDLVTVESGHDGPAPLGGLLVRSPWPPTGAVSRSSTPARPP